MKKVTCFQRTKFEHLFVFDCELARYLCNYLNLTYHYVQCTYDNDAFFKKSIRA